MFGFAVIEIDSD